MERTFTGTACRRAPRRGQGREVGEALADGDIGPQDDRVRGSRAVGRVVDVRESMPTNTTPASTSAWAAARVRYGWPSK